MLKLLKCLVILLVVVSITKGSEAVQICDFEVPHQANGYGYDLCVSLYCSGYTGTCRSLCEIRCDQEVDAQPLGSTGCCGVIWNCGSTGAAVWCCSQYC